MTVKELLQLLAKFEPDQEIVVETNACRHVHCQQIAGVVEIDYSMDDEWTVTIEVEELPRGHAAR